MILQNIFITFVKKYDMKRIDFCKLLINTRQNAGVGKNEMCRLAGFTFNQLQLLEDKPNNFAIKKAINYLAALHHVIVLSNSKSMTQITSAERFALWLKQTRNGIYLQRELADVVGCSYRTIANIEQHSNIPTIDVFLKILEALKYNIEIKQI